MALGKTLYLIIGLMFLVLIIPSYAVFPDTDQPYCRNVTITNPSANYPAYINISREANMAFDNMTDVRFYDSYCNNASSVELDYFIRDQSSGSWTTYDLEAVGGSQTVISILYGYTGYTTDRSNFSDVWDKRQGSGIHYTPTDEGTGSVVYDKVDVNGLNNGTIIGADWITNGRRGNALNYTRSNSDYVNFSDSNDVSDITIEAWINISSLPGSGNYYCFVSKEDAYILCVNNSGAIYWDVRSTSGWAGAIQSPFQLSVNTWYHIAATHNSSVMAIYINGQPNGTKSYANSIQNSADDNNYGRYPAGVHYMNGTIDEVKIYNQALNSSEILNHYISTEPTFTVGSEESGMGLGMTVTSPTNTTYSNVNIWINGTTTYSSNVTWSMNDYANETSCNQCTSFSNLTSAHVVEGSNNVKVYAVNESDPTQTTNATIYFTITINPRLNVTITLPPNNTALLNQAFNVTGNVNCTEGDCGDIYSWLIYSTDGTWTETTNDDFWDGYFFGSATNQSDSLRMIPNFTVWRRDSNNPVFIQSTGNYFDNDSVGWVSPIWNPDDNIYEFIYTGAYSAYIDRIGGSNSSTMNGNWNTNRSTSPVVPNTTGWDSFFDDAGKMIRHNSSFRELFYSGGNANPIPGPPNQMMGYATSNDTNTTWTPYAGNPIMNDTWPVNCTDVFAKSHIGWPFVWMEGNTYFMIYLCTLDSGGSDNMRWFLINFTDPTDQSTYQVMNNGQTIFGSNWTASSEAIMSGLLNFRYNSTTDIHYMFYDLYGGGNPRAVYLVWFFDDWIANTWDTSTPVLPLGSGGSWDDYMIGFAHFSTDRYGYPLYKSGDNWGLFYTGEPDGFNDWDVGLAYANYTWSEYESNTLDINRSTTIKNVSWTNTTCNGCDVNIQVGYSDDNSAWSWTSNYTSSPQTFSLSGRYVKYRVWLIGNNTHYPTLDSITISYESDTIINSTTALTGTNPYYCGYLNNTDPSYTNCSVSWNITPTEMGTFYLRIYANSSVLNNYSEFINLQISDIVNYYETPKFEGDTSLFYLTINGQRFSNLSTITADLIWNGTTYEGDRTIIGDYYNFTNTLTMPFITASSVNVSFYWQYTVYYTDGTSQEYSLESENQTIYQMDITNCSEGITTLNFTTYDEESPTTAIYTSMDAYFQFWYNNPDNKKNVSFSYSTDLSHTFCIFPNTSTIYADATIQYINSTYGARNYYLTNQTLTNTTQNISIYLLNNSSGHSVMLYVYSYYFEEPLSSVDINATRIIGGEWTTVEKGLTDDTGLYTFFLDPNINYQLYLQRSGYDDKTTSVIPVLTTYKVYMTPSETPSANYTASMWENVTLVIRPLGFALRNTTETFNYTIVSYDSAIEWWGMNLTWGNGTVLYSNNTTLGFGDGGVMEYSVNLSDEVGENITMRVWFKKEGYGAWYDPRTYIVEGYVVSRGLMWIFSNINLAPFAVGLIALICSMLFVGLTPASMPFGTRSGAGVIMLGILAIFTYYFNSTIWGWGVWFIGVLGVTSVLYLRGGW